MTMKPKFEMEKIEVDEKQVMKRANRVLGKEGHRLCKTRPPRSKATAKTERQIALGTYYVVGKKHIVEKHVNLEVFARKHGFLAPYEMIVWE